MGDEQGPLAGLRVVDFSGMIGGGFATAVMADFGADVVMAEHPERGDPTRQWPPFENDTSLWWKSIGRNKRCVTLDLSSDEGREVALELVADADVVVENFRPGTMERWGLGYETLKEVNEAVVMVRISGYGQTGPYADRPGFGTVAEGISGWAHANGFPDREPLLPPISLADLCAALFAVQATMFAVYERDVGDEDGPSGEGQVVDVSLYEPLFRLFVGTVEQYAATGETRTRTGNRHPNAAPRNVYETDDGFVTLSASSQAIFENVMEAIGRPDLVDDDRFEDNGRRVENAEELDAIIEEWTRERSTEDVLEAMHRHDAVVGPVNDMADAFEDEHFRARENVTTVDDGDVGQFRTAAPVPKFSRTPGSVSHGGPRHGEHNEDVYVSELGFDSERFERLREQGVI